MENENKRAHQKLNEDDLYYKLKEQDETIIKNIQPPDYACDCHGKYCNGFPVNVNPVLMEKIEAVQGLVDHPVTVISGVRCEMQNKVMDGSNLSFHKLGRAADIQCDTLGVDGLAEIAESVGLLVIRDYKEGMVHCQWNE
ncbi:D-Ala-D-Ala carboxypeptidase family metallohydrolase [Acetobacterium bakii]|uniref:Peptidase M15A C-terminal domain-containing protein n=1 Tax=Acetobacterium bakii TaxID=52689 RepID=A0A0L6TWI9_9FIRM|nr:D-Ala-D-Ala carboxypeptidase family metallohydrolase [Acetobacterium bakii]KNZ40427.1 hypothetical protein AKG39_17585 [Acetobacterium bakii]